MLSDDSRGCTSSEISVVASACSVSNHLEEGDVEHFLFPKHERMDIFSLVTFEYFSHRPKNVKHF